MGKCSSKLLLPRWLRRQRSRPGNVIAPESPYKSDSHASLETVTSKYPHTLKTNASHALSENEPGSADASSFRFRLDSNPNRESLATTANVPSINLSKISTPRSSISAIFRYTTRPTSGPCSTSSSLSDHPASISSTMAIHNWRLHSQDGSMTIPGTVNMDDTSSLRSASMSVGSGTISPIRGSITALYHWRLGKHRGGSEMDSLEESRSRVLSSVDGELISPVLSSSSMRVVADGNLPSPVPHAPAILPPVQTTERMLDEMDVGRMVGLSALSNPETERDVSNEADGIARNVSVVAS